MNPLLVTNQVSPSKIDSHYPTDEERSPPSKQEEKEKEHQQSSEAIEGFECIPLDDFLDRFDNLSLTSFRNAYTEASNNKTNKIETLANGKLTTSLPVTIFSLIQANMNITDEYILAHDLGWTDASATLVIRNATNTMDKLYKLQRLYRDDFLAADSAGELDAVSDDENRENNRHKQNKRTKKIIKKKKQTPSSTSKTSKTIKSTSYSSSSQLERVCAAANDFLNLAQLLDKWIESLKEDYKIDATVISSTTSTSVSSPNNGYILTTSQQASPKEENNDEGKRGEEQYVRPTYQFLVQNYEALSSLYSADAVYAASTQLSKLIMDPIYKEIGPKLFSKEWELKWTYNEAMVSVTRTMEDFLEDIEYYLVGSSGTNGTNTFNQTHAHTSLDDDVKSITSSNTNTTAMRSNESNLFLLQKLMSTLISESIIFYITTLLKKAKFIHTHPARSKQKRKALKFSYPSKAALRLQKDVDVLESFFDTVIMDRLAQLLGSSSSSSLVYVKSVIQREFALLVAIQEFIHAITNDAGVGTTVTSRSHKKRSSSSRKKSKTLASPSSPTSAAAARLQREIDAHEIQTYAYLIQHYTLDTNCTKFLVKELCYLFCRRKWKIVDKVLTKMTWDLTTMNINPGEKVGSSEKDESREDVGGNLESSSQSSLCNSILQIMDTEDIKPKKI